MAVVVVGRRADELLRAGSSSASTAPARPSAASAVASPGRGPNPARQSRRSACGSRTRPDRHPRADLRCACGCCLPSCRTSSGGCPSLERGCSSSADRRARARAILALVRERAQPPKRRRLLERQPWLRSPSRRWRAHSGRESPAPRASSLVRRSSRARSRSRRAGEPRWPPTPSATTGSTAGGSGDPKVIVEHYTANDSFSADVEHVRRRLARPGAERAAGRLRPLRDRHATGRSTSSSRSGRCAGTPSVSTAPRSGSSTSARATQQILSDPRQLRSLAPAHALADAALPHPARERDRPRREPHEPVSPRAGRRLALPDPRRLEPGRHGDLPRTTSPPGAPLPPRRGRRAAGSDHFPRAVSPPRAARFSAERRNTAWRWASRTNASTGSPGLASKNERVTPLLRT